MNYEIIYSNLITSRLEREIDPDEYYEKHHIWPKSIGGSDDKYNLVHLTAREHFIAHELLVKITDGQDRYKMSWSLMLMCGNNGRQNRKITGKHYEIARKLFYKEIRPFCSCMKGKKHTEDTKKKMSKAKKGKPSNRKNVILTKEQRKKLSDSHIGNSVSKETREKISSKMKNRKFSEEHKNKLKSRKLEIVICPYCKKEGAKPAMKRWHFENCKFKGESE